MVTQHAIEVEQYLARIEAMTGPRLKPISVEQHLMEILQPFVGKTQQRRDAKADG